MATEFFDIHSDSQRSDPLGGCSSGREISNPYSGNTPSEPASLGKNPINTPGNGGGDARIK
jgi:hypothetical protein